MLCARADGVMNGHYDLEEALHRIKGYEAAGADCVYVPLPGSIKAQEEVIAATALPVNVLVAGDFADISRARFAAMGAARLSLGSALARHLHRQIIDVGHGMFERGDFSPLAHSVSGANVDALMAKAT